MGWTVVRGSDRAGLLRARDEQHRLHPRRFGRAKRGQNALAELLPATPPERGNEVRQEPDRVIVTFVQRYPGDGAPAALLVPAPLIQ